MYFIFLMIWDIFCLYILQPEDASFASQKKVYDDLGKEMLDHAFAG